MKIDPDPQLVEETRRRYAEGEAVSSILIDLTAKGVRGLSRHRLLEVAFGLEPDDTGILTVWAPSAGSEANAALDKRLSTAIGKRANGPTRGR